MSSYHEIPKPAASSRGYLHTAALRGLAQIIALWRPANATAEEAQLATAARVAMRLSSRAGEAYSAEETRPAPGTPVHGVKAALSTNLSNATNNDLDFTAKLAGTAGNSVSIRYIISGTGSTVASVAVSGTAIVVTAGSATTASSVKTAVEANAQAAALVDIANKAGNNGSDVIAALAATNLTGGIDATPARAGQVLYDETNVYIALADVATSSTAGWKKIAHASL